MKIKIEKKIPVSKTIRGKERKAHTKPMAEAMKKIKKGESFELSAKSHGELQSMTSCAKALSVFIGLLIDNRAKFKVVKNIDKMSVRVWRTK